VSPQLAHLKKIGRVKMSYALDSEVIEALQTLMRTEGILPALESAHAVVEAMKIAPTLSAEKIIVI
jgi:tryptophan synthase beta subunit